LKQLINTKELCKQIRYYGNRNSLIWSREESQHFITNRHFLVRFEEMPNDVLAALFGVFYKLLGIGETVQVQHGTIIDVVKPIDYSKIYQPERPDIEGEFTPFIREFGTKQFGRVIKFPSHYSLINLDYMKLSAADENPKTKDNTPLVPVYLADGNLIVLPYRTTDGNKVIDDLLGAENQIGKDHSNNK
jgi:hypothetical protein